MGGFHNTPLLLLSWDVGDQVKLAPDRITSPQRDFCDRLPQSGELSSAQRARPKCRRWFGKLFPLKDDLIVVQKSGEIVPAHPGVSDELLCRVKTRELIVEKISCYILQEVLH